MLRLDSSEVLGLFNPSVHIVVLTVAIKAQHVLIFGGYVDTLQNLITFYEKIQCRNHEIPKDSHMSSHF